ncbi:modular serine protease-like [Choristoneura fumiferana]|uniref:modular serine protease-like n=1 Tax=Choristoneura fumiferana TaxID=7141 RepID=UPI003D157E1F
MVKAAHCLWNDETNSPYAPKKFAVALGKIYRAWDDVGDPGAHKSDVKSIAVPARFRGGKTNYQEDISLVILSTPVKYSPFIQPVCIDFSRELESVQLDTSLGKVAGWGLTSEDGPPSQVLKTKELLHVDLRRCMQDLPANFISMVTGDKICADAIKGTTICRGDSGGGVAFPTLDGRGIQRYYLRGVVSTAPASEHLCNVKSHILLTRVSDHEIFITQKYP